MTPELSDIAAFNECMARVAETMLQPLPQESLLHVNEYPGLENVGCSTIHPFKRDCDGKPMEIDKEKPL